MGRMSATSPKGFSKLDEQQVLDLLTKFRKTLNKLQDFQNATKDLPIHVAVNRERLGNNLSDWQMNDCSVLEMRADPPLQLWRTILLRGPSLPHCHPQLLGLGFGEIKAGRNYTGQNPISMLAFVPFYLPLVIKFHVQNVFAQRQINLHKQVWQIFINNNSWLHGYCPDISCREYLKNILVVIMVSAELFAKVTGNHRSHLLAGNNFCEQKRTRALMSKTFRAYNDTVLFYLAKDHAHWQL